MDIPDQQNHRATAAKVSGTRDILGLISVQEGRGRGGGREGKDPEEKRSCESYVNITTSGISRKEFIVSMKFYLATVESPLKYSQYWDATKLKIR